MLALAHTGELRERAAEGLGRGMPAREAALARGFVLGADEGVDERTKEDFRRSGLSHLLAVSGQNVTLLALLAMPLMGALGVPLRERLLWVLGLIAVYVPLAGAGPSIQRAAVMGGVGVLATLAGRRASRLYALAAALIVTLAIDPGVAADIGWQLSFAAVSGILLLAAPLREAIATRLGTGGWRRALAEGAAVTIAATLATAPLIAFHFETFSATTLLANLLALPAVAPAMWLGMAVAAASQVPGFPLEALNWLEAPLLGYIAQVAAWCGRPGWAEIEVELGAAGLAGAYSGSGGRDRADRPPRAASAADGCATERRGTPGWRSPPEIESGRRRASAWLVLATLAAVGSAALLVDGERSDAGPPTSGLRIEVLDVGQGDAILLQPAGAPAVLVDGGPPGDDLAGKLRAAGVERLGAAVDQPRRVRSRRLGSKSCSAASRSPGSSTRGWGSGRWRSARAAGAAPLRAAAGEELRSGALRLQVLWPPAAAARRTSRRRRPEPAGAGPARPLARLLDAAERRRGGRGGAAGSRPGRRAQGRPPRQRRRRPGCPAGAHAAAPGGDLGRRRQPLRPPDPRHPGDARGARRRDAAHGPRRHRRRSRSNGGAVQVESGG